MNTTKFIEKRKSKRVLCNKRVKVLDKFLGKPMLANDISCHGALLKTRTSMYEGDMLKLAMHLPIEKDPINVNAKVVRTVTICTSWGFRNFDIGVEFLNLNDSHKEKLTRTVNYLLRLLSEHPTTHPKTDLSTI